VWGENVEILSYGASLTGSSCVNGDSFYISSDKKVFVLSDGASGAGENGKTVMSKICVEMAKEFDFSSSNLAPKEYIDCLFYKINNRLIEISQNKRHLFYGTIIIAIIDEGVLTITTLGNSPAYIFSCGEVRRLAKHKQKYEDLVEQGYITRDEYDGYLKHMHERARGCFEWFMPDVVPPNVIEEYTLMPEDMIFMCSDGLSDWIKPDSVFGTLESHGVEDGVNTLLRQAKEISFTEKLYYDDITAIAVHCQ